MFRSRSGAMKGGCVAGGHPKVARYVGPLFELYDINGDGVITLDEFVSLERQYVEILGLPTPTDQMIADTFKKYDKDGNKKLDFQESTAEFMTLVYV